ncbi:hypothetical protein BJV77DRAFT_1057924 [Russula vinacea]|nr:hypothetical protein BJV77DRAFT_1057924 [Russula vinacea]
MASTLTEYLDSQQELEKEAALALPYSFSHCTFSRGHVRQAVYLCITCASRRGICSSCSIACHTDHEQIELFPKRNFRCDCPTSALTQPCSLHKHPEAPNEENEYGQNFDVGRETMIQCLACEDWFHESCLNLRTRPPSRLPSPEPVAEENGIAQVDQEDDSRSDVSSSGLPPPLITAGDYDALVCRKCWAGTPGVAMVVREDPDVSWKVIGELEDGDVVVDVGPEADGRIPAHVEASDPDHTHTHPATQSSSGGASPPQPDPDTLQGRKRSLVNSSDGPNVKRSLFAQTGTQTLGAGDIFLSGDWRKRWCSCDSCFSGLRKHPYLLEEEETYQPPEDPDSQLSLEQLGIRALERLPRDRALDGIRAFNTMRDDLKNFLRPFAQEGREVQEMDVRRFFEARAEVAGVGQK